MMHSIENSESHTAIEGYYAYFFKLFEVIIRPAIFQLRLIMYGGKSIGS
jgi:hypothetical protein